jgi:hypothetical protein
MFADRGAVANDPFSPYGLTRLPDRDKLFLERGVAVAVAGTAGVSDGLRNVNLLEVAQQVLTEFCSLGPAAIASRLLAEFDAVADFVRRHGEVVTAAEEFGRPSVLAVALVAGVQDGVAVAFSVALTADGPCLGSWVNPPGTGLAPAGCEDLMQAAVVDAAGVGTVEERVARIDAAVAQVFLHTPLAVCRGWSYGRVGSGVSDGGLVAVTPDAFRLSRVV